jgi:hypothetical protein
MRHVERRIRNRRPRCGPSGAVIVGHSPDSHLYPCSHLAGVSPQGNATATHIYTPVPVVGVVGVSGLTGLDQVPSTEGFKMYLQSTDALGTPGIVAGLCWREAIGPHRI